MAAMGNNVYVCCLGMYEEKQVAFDVMFDYGSLRFNGLMRFMTENE
jgi:hypothetical protein